LRPKRGYNTARKEASGLRLFPKLDGVQVVAGSNPTAEGIKVQLVTPEDMLKL